MFVAELLVVGCIVCTCFVVVSFLERQHGCCDGVCEADKSGNTSGCLQ